MSNENEESKGGEGKPKPPQMKLITEGKDPKNVDTRKDRFIQLSAEAKMQNDKGNKKKK